MPASNPIPLAQRAGMLCNDEQFQTFVAHTLRLEKPRVEAEAAAEYIRYACNIDSRRELDTKPAAAIQFEIIRTEFDAWRGAIPAQR